MSICVLYRRDPYSFLPRLARGRRASAECAIKSSREIAASIQSPRLKRVSSIIRESRLGFSGQPRIKRGRVQEGSRLYKRQKKPVFCPTTKRLDAFGTMRADFLVAESESLMSICVLYRRDPYSFFPQQMDGALGTEYRGTGKTSEATTDFTV